SCRPTSCSTCARRPGGLTSTRRSPASTRPVRRPTAAAALPGSPPSTPSGRSSGTSGAAALDVLYVSRRLIHITGGSGDVKRQGELPPAAIRAYSFTLFTKLEGAITTLMVHLGDRLGLYRALAAADEPLTSGELAGRTELHERWVREWLHNQAAAKLMTVDD